MPPPPAATITLPDTLALLDGAFAEFAQGIAAGAYGVWLGSGISLRKMPGLKLVAGVVIEHLRVRAAAAGPCAFRDSLERILKLMPLSDAQRAAIDYGLPFDQWADRVVIAEAFVSNYAKALDQAPKGQKADYLLWDAVEVVQRYADPAILPGVEHLALAALVMEGVAPDIASANWDGLLEAAVRRLAGTLEDILQVRVLAADVREGPARSRLYKFHGCAVLAGDQEDPYRDKLVARHSQLDTWAHENDVIEGKLIDLVLTKPTLMLGLSAQDHNIRRVFNDAKQQMTWPFPSHPPAFVFSEDEIGFDQATLLKTQYPKLYEAQSDAIDAAALLRAYGGALLPALWLQVLTAKLAVLLTMAAGLTAADAATLKAGLSVLRDRAAAAEVGLDREAFVTAALGHVGRTLTLLRTGRAAVTGGGLYEPLSTVATPAMVNDPNIRDFGLPEFAVGVALLGHGLAAGLWSCEVTQPVGTGTGALRVTGARAVEVFFAASAKAAAQLVAQGHVDAAADVVLVHSDPIQAPAARSAAATYGRTSRIGLREVSVRSVLDSGADLPGMVQRVQLELAL